MDPGKCSLLARPAVGVAARGPGVRPACLAVFRPGFLVFARPGFLAGSRPGFLVVSGPGQCSPLVRPAFLVCLSFIQVFASFFVLLLVVSRFLDYPRM